MQVFKSTKLRQADSESSHDHPCEHGRRVAVAVDLDDAVSLNVVRGVPDCVTAKLCERTVLGEEKGEGVDIGVAVTLRLTPDMDGRAEADSLGVPPLDSVVNAVGTDDTEKRLADALLDMIELRVTATVLLT